MSDRHISCNQPSAGRTPSNVKWHKRMLDPVCFANVIQKGPTNTTSRIVRLRVGPTLLIMMISNDGLVILGLGLGDT
jgi:hypothetical protein